MAFNDLHTHLAQQSLLATTPWSPPCEEKVKGQQGPPTIKEIYEDFIQTLQYRPQNAIPEDNVTYQSLLSEFSAYDTGGKWFKALCRESSTIAELCYSHNSPEVRLRIARFTWYLIYVDDLGQKFPSFLQSFQQRIYANDEVEGSFLKDFREHLADFYSLWDPIAANCITSSALEFVSGCLLEQMPAVRDMKISSSASSWPYYLRNKTGSAGAYAFMLFPKEHNIDMTVYIQIIEDIVLFTNLTNDILSFYKEDLAGETNNYVYNRAHVSQKSVPETLQDVVKDTLDAHRRITEVLDGTEGYIPWLGFVNGYLAFHHTLKRYRLGDLGLPVSY